MARPKIENSIMQGYLMDKIKEKMQESSSTEPPNIVDADIELECDGGIVPAHKLILMNSCSYFDKMFTLEMAEKNSGRVNFTNFSKVVIEIIIQHIYTGSLPYLKFDPDELKELIAVCHMMEIKRLLNYTWNTLSSHLNMETFFELWSVAVKYDLEINSKMITFYDRNIKKILKGEYLKDFTEEEFVTFIQYAEPSDRISCIFKWKCNEEREEIAAKLLQEIDERFFKTSHLNLLVNQDEKRTTDSILKDKVIKNLTEKCEQHGKFLREIITDCRKGFPVEGILTKCEQACRENSL